MVQRYRASGSGVYAEDAGAYVKYVAYEKLEAELKQKYKGQWSTIELFPVFSFLFPLC